MEELLQILNKLEENTNIILEENKKLENEIKILKGENPGTEEPTPEYSYDGGLLGDLADDEIKILKGEILNYLDCTNIGISSVDGAEINSSARLSTDYIATGNIKGKVKVNCTNDYYYLVSLTIGFGLVILLRKMLYP